MDFSYVDLPVRILVGRGGLERPNWAYAESFRARRMGCRDALTEALRSAPQVKQV